MKIVFTNLIIHYKITYILSMVSSKRPETSDKIWIARFWAQYKMLSEPLRDGFVYLAKSIDKAAKSKRSTEGKDIKK